jgi:hypothetical protein
MPILIKKSAKPIPNKVNRQKSSDPQKFPVDEQSRNRLAGAKPGVVGNHRIELFQPPQKNTALKSPHQFVGALYISRSIATTEPPRRGRALRRWARNARLRRSKKKLRRYQALMDIKPASSKKMLQFSRPDKILVSRPSTLPNNGFREGRCAGGACA